MTYIDGAHLSLRYDAKPVSIGRYVASVAREGVSVITMTELNRKMAKATRARLPHGWRLVRHGEYGFAWDTKVFRAGPGIIHRKRLTYIHRNPRDAWRDVWVASRRLVHRETKTLLRFDVAHMPSMVEHGTKFRSEVQPRDKLVGKQVRAWKRGMNKHGLRAAGRPDQLVQVLAMDANVNYHEERWRNEVRTRVGMPSVWDEHRPRGGTHGRRLIDVVHSTHELDKGNHVRTVRPADVDHGGIRYRVNLDQAA